MLQPMDVISTFYCLEMSKGVPTREPTQFTTSLSRVGLRKIQFFRSGLNWTSSLKPWVKWVRVGLKVNWPT